MQIFEPAQGKINLKEVIGHLNAATIGTGIVAWLFGVTGPALIILSAAKQAHLTLAMTISWLFIIYLVGGLISIFFALYYRQPVAAAWTIPGAVLVGSALTHISFNQAVGAYIITGLLVFLLGVSGIVKKAMRWLPVPVMLGMVAGVLMPLGVNVISSIPKLPLVGAITLVSFVLFSSSKKLAQKIPPVLGALVIGLIAATIDRVANWGVLSIGIAHPVLVTPGFSLDSFLELTIPLTLMVIGVQNVQAIGVLVNQGYKPPINSFTIISGLGTLVNSFFGGHPACIAGPTTAICSSPSSGAKDGRYVASIINGILWILFALVTPVAASITKILPAALISILGGLAMLGVLVGTFKDAFTGRFKMGAVFAFLITVSGISLFKIGSPFWGLIGGVIASYLLEKEDFQNVNNPA
ncbi:benzoate/H(+) symporter BenE family transporter [Desulfotomaculum copahuensis]|uniref:Benzoate transporter n=1 Tax=Desulfotomaculum copahuensis TaxID=1838280 RepID=A0A1B7LIJ3_9FIRM|nr:benzoate/H(+) symporter BenE family transporter [Desulfotomaculum copahuensis]OAT86384.1 benzoate transporter [Desulfotomaculum copahuensis]